jgi:transcription elongation factor Elf1
MRNMTPEKAARGGPVEACHPKEVSTGTDFKVCPCGKHYIQGTVKEKQCPACNARELAELAEDIPAVMFHCPNCRLEFQDEIRRRASCPYSDPVKQRMDERLGRGERLQGMT